MISRQFKLIGRRGPYAAVIPLFVKSLMHHESPVINGDGLFSRDFTYVDNVIQVNHLAALVNDRSAINQIYNVAHGERTTLIDLFRLIRQVIGKSDERVLDIEPVFGPERPGDIPHSLASIEKASRLLDYKPEFTVRSGLEEAIEWYRAYL